MFEPDRINRKFARIGCAVAALLLILGLLLAGSLVANQQYHAVRYPDAEPIPAYSGLKIRTNFIHTATAYRSQEQLYRLKDWYVDNLSLRIILDEGDCVTLERATKHVVFWQTTTVLVCDTPAEQQIFVTRSISFR